MNILRFFVLSSTLAAAAAAQVAVPPTKRADVLALSSSMLAPKEVSSAQVANPFYSAAFAETVGTAGVAGPAAGAVQPGTAGKPAGPLTGGALLTAIAEGLRPSGFFVIGGEPTLVFGQKRVKAGGELTINFEGAEYTVVITAITPPNFTIRLGNEEFTRPIR